MTLVEVDYQGTRFVFEHWKDDHVARQQRRAGFYERPFLESCRHLLEKRPPKQWVLDVGAHVGNHAVFFHRVCRRPVAAFEAHPDLYRCLVQNLYRPHPGDALPLKWAVHTAVGAGDPFCSVCEHDDNTGMSRVLFDLDGLPGQRLDALEFRTGVALVKLDIEGMEEAALLGGSSFLSNYRPIVAIEDTHTPPNPGSWLKRLPLDYVWYSTTGATPMHTFVPAENR